MKRILQRALLVLAPFMFWDDDSCVEITMMEISPEEIVLTLPSHRALPTGTRLRLARPMGRGRGTWASRWLLVKGFAEVTKQHGNGRLEIQLTGGSVIDASCVQVSGMSRRM